MVPANIGGLFNIANRPPPVTAFLRVTGIVRPTGQAAAFWSSDNIVSAPGLENAGTITEHWAGAVLIGPGEIAALPRVFRSSQQISILWDLPLRLGALTASGVPQLQRTLQALQVTGPTTNNSDFPQSLGILNSPVGILTQFRARRLRLTRCCR